MSILLTSQLFPPAVGGSAVLFEGVYSRLDANVVVLTDQELSPASDECPDEMVVVRRRMKNDTWGLINPLALSHHLRVASWIRSLSQRRSTYVHCGRTLPEGLAAMLNRLAGGADYLCWAHGEDLTMQSQSREMRFLTQRICNHAVGLLANSHATARLLAGLGVANEKIHIVHPGVDPQRFHPHVDAGAIKLELAPEGEQLILSVGRLERRKGFDKTVEAMAQLARSHPRLKYVIVGDGPDRGYLEDLVAQLGLQASVHFAGKVHDSELPAYYAACDVFVHPNRIEGVDVEGFGIVFLEAAATGRPVVAGNTGGVPEAVEDGTTGTLVSGQDSQEIAASICRLLDDQDLRTRMGKAARSRVIERFTWEAAATRVAQIHSSLGPAR